MAKRQYPRAIYRWFLRGDKKRECTDCEAPIDLHWPVLEITDQVDFMRGNDEVSYYCIDCALAGHRDSIPKTTSDWASQ